VAAVNEFGAPGANIPERSFMRSTADEQRSATERIKAAELDKIWAGRSDVSTSLKRLGEFMQAKIQRKIASGVPPVNAPATLLRKRRKGKWNRGKATFAGTIKTLIDTGALRQAIRYEMVD